MRLTAAQIDAARSPRGGWSRKTLAGWGIPWPPPSGWRQRLIYGDDPPGHDCVCRTCGTNLTEQLGWRPLDEKE